MKKIFNKEVIIGLSVIGAIVILIFGIEYLKGINLFSPANFYYVYYDNVNGLERSAPVTIDGYKVGQVRDVVFDYENPGKIKVLLAVDKNLKIPEDSRAELASTLMSGSYVNIKLGRSKKMLAVGSDIQSSASKDLFDSLSSDVMPNVASILPRVDSLLFNLNLLVTDPALYQSIQRLDGITDNVYGASNGLNTTMVGIGNLVNTINGDVPGIMGGARGAATKIDSVAANLMILSQQLKNLPVNNTFDNVNSTLENVNILSANLAKFSEQLSDKNSTLGLLTSDPELYYKLNRVTADIDSLIIDIKKNPKRYISIKLL